MKRFQFRLHAVLKMRTMLEEKCRSELGMLMVERQNLVEQIETLRHDIDGTYREQESIMSTGMKAGHAAFFPMAVAGKEARIKEVEKEMTELDQRIEDKKKELMQLRADLKLMENLHEKELSAWKKAYNKDTDLKVEEMVQLWDESRKEQGDRS